MITGVEIRGFRGIKEGNLRDLAQVSILIGRNGSGKSTVLEALYLISACAEPTDPIREVSKLDYIVNRRGGRGRWDTSRELLWYAGDTDKPIEVDVGIKGKKYRFIAANYYREGYDPVRLLMTDGRLLNLNEEAVSESIKTLLSKTKVKLSEDLIAVKEFLMGVLFIDDILVRDPVKIEQYAWRKLVIKRLDKRVIELIREEFEPEAEDLTYISADGDYYLMLKIRETAVRVDDLADGARSALLTAMLIYASKPRLVLIEEPEVHMHPAGLYTYMKFLLRLAKELEFQMVLSTHSIELIQFAESIVRELGMDITVQFIERERGVVRARRFTLNDTELLRKLGIDVRLLYKF